MNRRDAQTQMFYELERHQDDLMESWIDKSLPEGWTGLDFTLPVNRHKTRVTLRLDSDMLKWFRKLGPNYGPRVNRVLRIYWTSLLSGQVSGYPFDNVVPRIKLDAIEKVRAMQEEARELVKEMRK